MLLAFATRALRAVCEDESKAVEAYGQRIAESLVARLADLRAAPTVDDLFVGRPVVSLTPVPCVTVRLADGYVLRCEVNHPGPTRRVEEDRFDWAGVRRLKVIAVAEGGTTP